MKIALLGLPQSGKRTLFTLLTGRQASEGIVTEPLEGVAPVRDPRVDKIAEIEVPDKIVYAETLVTLCPDIDPGAGSTSWINEAKLSEMLCMMIRDFASEEVYHPNGSVDAKRDRMNLEAELLIADLGIVENRLERIAKDRKRNKPTTAQLLEEKVINRFKETLDEEKMLYGISLTDEEYASTRSLNLLTLKPILWCYNVSEGDLAKESKSNEFNVSALIEAEIMTIEDREERAEFMKDIGLTDSGVNRLNSAAYNMLGLMSFYTMGPDEARAWTIKKGTLAPDAGGKIHTDIKRGFIRVEVVKFDDLVTEGSEKAVKAAGKALLKGKDYIIEDGDICNFRFNV